MRESRNHVGCPARQTNPVQGRPAPGATANNRTPHAPRAGFTLVEVLLAITLTAMICAVLYGVIYSVLSTQAKLAGYNEAAMVADRIADMIAQDIQSAYVADYEGDTPFLGKNEQEFGRPAGRLTLITSMPPKMPTLEHDKPGIEGFNEVTYAAVASQTREGYLALYRREAPLDKKTEEGGRFALLHDQVESFELRFLGKEDMEIDWDQGQEEWEYSPESGLPRLVLLSLTVSIGNPDTEEDQQDKSRISRFRRQEIYRVIALPAGMSEDTSKLAVLEPTSPRAKKGAVGAGGTPGQNPAQGGPSGSVNPQTGLNPLLRSLPGGGKTPSFGQPSGNPLLKLLQRHQMGR